MIRVLCNTRPVFVVVQSGRRVSIAVSILLVGMRSFSTDRDTVIFVQKLIATFIGVRDPDLRGLQATSVLKC